MPKPMPGWLSPSYSLNSTNASLQRSLNLYSEVIEVEGEKAVGYLKGRPGLAEAALATLPTSPLRGLLAGGTPLYPLDGTGGRMFAVAGSKLYEVFLNGTYTDRGDVGNDGKPVQMFVNGDQLAIVSGGAFYLDNGLGPVQTSWQGSSYTDIAVGWGGTCTTAGGSMTRTTGPLFNQGMVGLTVTIPSGNYLIAGVVDGNHLITLSDLGINTTPVVCTIGPGSAGTCTTAGGSMQRLTGPAFVSAMIGLTVTVGGFTHIIAGVVNGDYLITLTNMGVNTGVAYNMGAVSGKLTSRLKPFTQADVGGVLAFAGPAPWGTIGVTIVSVDAFGNADVSASPAPAGSTGGIATQNFGPVTAAVGAFLNSFFIVAPPTSRSMYSSEARNGLTWDSADQAAKESYPDYIGALYADHQELYVLGEAKSEVWHSAESAAFPFQRDEGASLNVGIAAPASVAGFLDGIAFIGGSLRGQPVAYWVKGFQPDRITTHAIEQFWKDSFTQLSDAVAFPFEMHGHEFWVVIFPTADQTWVYDRTASKQFGKPMWHEWNSWDATSAPPAYHRHRACCHCFVWGKHWVGDFATSGANAGKIYEMSPTQYTDAGQVISCSRTLPHLCTERIRQFFPKFQLDAETAKGGVALTVVLTWSDDGGHTFVGGGSAFTLTTSTTLTMQRLCFWQLGSADDRVFKITVTGNAPKTLINAYLDVIAGVS